MKNRLKRQNFIAIFVIISSIAIVYHPIISNDILFVSGDGIGYYLSKVFLYKGIKQGELPLWNPYCSIGTPFLADTQQTVFNPLNLIYFIFDTPFAFNLSRMIRLICAAFFMYLLIKEITKDCEIGLITGLMFAFSTVLGGARIEHDTIITTVALFPMILYFLEKFKNTNRTEWIAISALSMAVQFFSGFTQIVLYFDIMCFFYMISVLHQNQYKLKDGILLCMKWIGLYLLLISIQLLPTIQLIVQSGRDTISWEIFSVLAYDFRILLFMLFPYVYKNQFEAFGVYSSSGIDIEIYIGIVCVTYFIYELRYCLKERKVKVFAGIWITSFLFGMAPHIPFVGKILYHIPIINSFRVCARSLPIFIFISIILTGMGLAQALNPDHIKRIVKISFILSGVVIANTIFVYCVFSQPTVIWENDIAYYHVLKKGMLLSSFLCIFHTICLIFLLKSKREMVKRGILFVIGFSIILDVMQFSVKIREQRVDVEKLFDSGISQQTELFIEEDTQNAYRSFAAIERVEEYFSPDISIAKCQRNIDSQNRFYNSYLTFLDRKLAYWQIKETFCYPLFLQQIQSDNGLVSMLGIHYILDAWNHDINSNRIENEQQGGEVQTESQYNEIIVSDSNISIFENKEAKQLLYVPDKVISIDGYGESWIQDDLKEVDKINYIVNFGRTMDLYNSNTSVEDIVIKRNSVSASISAKTETFINHSQLAYSGWNAYVDGKKTEIYTVNNLIQGMIVPEGNHKIEFRFEPIEVKIGFLLSIFGLLWCTVWIVTGYRKRTEYHI